MPDRFKVKTGPSFDFPLPSPREPRDPKDLAEFLKMLTEDLTKAHLTEIQLAAIVMAARQLADRAEELLQEQRMHAGSCRKASELLELVKSSYGERLTYLEIESWQEWQIAPGEARQTVRALLSPSLP